MLGKLKILLLLAMMIAHSLSTTTAPPKAATSSPRRPNPLEKLATELGVTEEEFKCIAINMRFELRSVIADFSSKLMDEFMKDPENLGKNIVFSPYSIQIVMTMVLVGAEKDTESRRQLIQALAYKDDTNAGKCMFNFRRLRDYFLQVDTGVKQAVRTFIKDGFPIHPTYNTFTQGFLRTSAVRLDPFNPEDQINKYVERATQGRIKEIMQPGSIGDAVMVLVDATSHEGKWKFKFNRMGQMTFNRLGGQTSFKFAHGMMMDKNFELRYAYSKDLECEFLELPYKSGKGKSKVSMFVGKPSHNTWEALKKAATGFSYEKMKDKFSCSEGGIKVTMPHIETTFRSEMIPKMKDLGVTDIFGFDTAKLSYISKKLLKITDIVHKASIKITKDGSSASAGTVVVSCARSLVHRSKVIDFNINAPFFITIVDTFFGITLFSGVILDPSQ